MTTHVFGTMGTVVSLRTDHPLHADDLSSIEAVFRHYDRTYSLYDEASPLSQVARGDLHLADTTPEVRETYNQALVWRSETAGLFTPHRPDDVIDLSGTVKALAIQDAGRLLDSASKSWLLTVGGDSLARTTAPTPDWRIGITNPENTAEILGVAPLSSRRRAIATSGTAERGNHIWSRHSDTPFVQATVRADDILTADVIATAVIAGLHNDLNKMTSQWDIDVLTIDRDGNILATPEARSWITSTLRKPTVGDR